MTLGRAPHQETLIHEATELCEKELAATSIHRLLHDECHRLFPDDSFADVFRDTGRQCVPPRIVAVVMVLQRFEGLSDREAVDRFKFDVRWKYAAGGLDLAYPGFVHTVLVDMRARLRGSKAPDRIFDAALAMAKAAGLIGRRRVLDSTALYDAVATQDTVTMIRSAIRGLLRVTPAPLVGELRAALEREDDYATAGKPVCDWEDKAAREDLIDALARDAHALLALLDDLVLAPEVKQAAELLAVVVGQDLEQTADGRFRIARRVAPDRVISTVDPEARHGHKTEHRSFDGYKGHVAIEPDSEIITAATVSAANVGDGSIAKELLEEALEPQTPASPAEEGTKAIGEPIEVYGDASYGTAEVLEHLEKAGAVAQVKVQAPSAPKGHFTKDAFRIDLAHGTVSCPAERLVKIRRRDDGAGIAIFGSACVSCPLRGSCTDNKEGRTVRVHRNEQRLLDARTRQKDAEWRAKYKATRPKVERKIGHLMRRRHGGRRCRMRGTVRVRQDFLLLAAATNFGRMAVLRTRPAAPGMGGEAH